MSTKIWILVFANATMLAPVLLQHNIIPKIELFYEFINGFNSVDELVTFTNVGHGKELTDTKIKGTHVLTKTNAALMTMFASWPQCAKIILGGSHDNGYSRILSKLVTDNILPKKVALLQGPPFAAELAQLSTSIFPRLRFGDLFMTTKLESATEKSTSYVQIASNGVLQMSRKTSSPTIPGTVVPYKSERPEKGTPLVYAADRQPFISLSDNLSRLHATVTISAHRDATRLSLNAITRIHTH
jgi:hypothetical protein